MLETLNNSLIQKNHDKYDIKYKNKRISDEKFNINKNKEFLTIVKEKRINDIFSSKNGKLDISLYKKRFLLKSVKIIITQTKKEKYIIIKQ